MPKFRLRGRWLYYFTAMYIYIQQHRNPPVSILHRLLFYVVSRSSILSARLFFLTMYIRSIDVNSSLQQNDLRNIVSLYSQTVQGGGDSEGGAVSLLRGTYKNYPFRRTFLSDYFSSDTFLLHERSKLDTESVVIIKQRRSFSVVSFGTREPSVLARL